jgi:hypothetical protein
VTDVLLEANGLIEGLLHPSHDIRSNERDDATLQEISTALS